MRPRLYAILSDIHANFQALKAVEADAVRVCKALDAESLHFVTLGDVVDYGPQPNKCMAWVEQHAEIMVQGNHDFDVSESLYEPPQTIDAAYWPITIWTRAVLKREHKVRMRAWRTGVCRLNQRLPGDLEPFMLFHSSLTHGYYGRINTPRDAWNNLQHIRDGIDYGLFGHTHIQGYFVDDPLRKNRVDDKTTEMHVVCPEKTRLNNVTTNDWTPLVLETEPDSPDTGRSNWSAMPQFRALFNPGAVGQPRLPGAARIVAPHDNRAAYMLLKNNGSVQFQFRRVPYDVDETIRLLRETVYWPPAPHQDKQGSDILKAVEGANPFSKDMWNTLMGNFRSKLTSMETALPKLVNDTLVPQLR